MVHEAPAETQRVLIVGAGFAGLAMGITLKEAGIDEFTILEQADEVGGTWRDNRYPGCGCDVQSHLYSFSFEPNPRWSRMFARQEEILQYLVHCTDKYGLRPHIRFRTAVLDARFDEPTGLWEVRTRAGDVIRARVLVTGCGVLSRPSYPDIAGLSTFAGKTFHSADWDAAFPLEGRTVAVIGTGASAVQIIPSIAPKVARLAVYQRTPPWVLPKPDREIGAVEQALFARVPALQKALRRVIYWQREALVLGLAVEPRLMKIAEAVGRKYVEESVADPALRAKVLPTYAMGCKRIVPSNDYYGALQRENVEVVTEPIAEIRANGVLTRDGTERQADALVLATGFQAAEHVAPFELRGRAGARLDEVWRDGAEAYLGTTVSGFPNLFMMTGPNTLLGHSSMVFIIEAQARYVLSSIRAMRERRLKLVDVRADAQARYNERLQERLGKTVWASGCTSWYKTRSGKNTMLWPGFTFEYRLRTRRFEPRDYELVPAG